MIYKRNSVLVNIYPYIEKFEGEDFIFRLTTQEAEDLSRCKNFTLNRGAGCG